MSRECRYICQRAANAIISEVGSYRVSTDALLGINQFLDEFLIHLLTNCQSLDLSLIKTSVFNLLPSTLGKNAIVEAELEVKTFTETEVIDYDIYEKMRSIGTPFPTQKCLPLLRDKCFEFCTLADKDDQQSWMPHEECDDLIISPIVAIYVTTVLEHMAEYILTAVALTAETEDTDYVRIKELFLALIDDVQVGMIFRQMDLRDKMEKRSFAHGYMPRSSVLQPNIIRNSTASEHQGKNLLGEINFDDLDLHYDDDDDTNPQRSSGLGPHASSSNYSVKSNGNKRPSYKVFKNDQGSFATEQPAYSSAYDPDAPTMNFEDLIRSGNTMRVSLTPYRLKSIEIKDQMLDDPIPSKPAWKRRSASVPRMSTSSTSTSRPQTPTPSGHHHRPHSPLPKMIKTDHRFENPREAPKPPSTDSSSIASSTTSKIKAVEKSLPTPTSSTSSRQSKNRPPVPSDMKLPSSSSSSSLASSIKSSKASDKQPSSVDTSSPKPSQTVPSTTTSNITTTTTTITPTTAKPIGSSSRPTLRRGSLSNRKSRENLRRTTDSIDESTSSSQEQLTNEPESIQDNNNNNKRPERPSSIVAKRASMANPSRRQSLHESYAINVTDTNQDTTNTTSRQLSTPPTIQQKSSSRKSLVLDKVLQFERAHSLDDIAQRRASSYIPRRERFMYLQRDPNALERPTNKSTSTSSAATYHSTLSDDDMDDTASEHGVVDGDEEWFLPEDEWEDIQEQENAVVEWLLGEA
ncbi:uncharacterized protein BX664DRAFT_301765 [Halteromyces radiatus]|uniref:uncharacterized protein n=1 Tax=Halteromyces radiatus TaxID=101107 RepID=UPI00221FA5A9|nr:uncharacterized protein BX664DRAFT_301765 [Halteromyces radiatus]KAI8083127.1 hypothetical protein BX664DRAFT_301765 [Halteromyces radiatus]